MRPLRHGPRWLAGGACLVALLGAPARAEAVDQAALERCQRTEDRLDRLVCFDALAAGRAGPIPAAPAAAAPSTAPAASTASAVPPAAAMPVAAPPLPYRRVTLVDLQVDAAELRGQRLEVTGVLQQVGQMVMLKDDLFSVSAVFVEIAAVPREERRRMLQLCTPGCTATVRGVGATVMANPGVKAERVEIP